MVTLQATTKRRLTYCAMLAGLAALAGAASAAAKAGPVTDANVAERVESARTDADHAALAKYFKAKSEAETPRIEHFEKLYRAYLQLDGKSWGAVQNDARSLLKAARMSQAEYSELAQAHLHLSWKDE